MSSTVPSAQQIPAVLSNIAAGYMRTRALYVAATLELADHLRQRPQTCDELARTVEAHPRALYLLLRSLESLGLFREPEPGLFALTPLGMHLCKDAPGGFHSFILMTGMFWTLWEGLPYTIKTGQSADQHILGMSSFDYLQQHPQEAAIFNEAMTLRVSAFAPAIVASYDFSPFHTITDIGGGHGKLLATILQAVPSARGVLFDMPVTIEGARQAMEQQGLSGRCSYVSGDFFAEVPGGDLQILSAVISDWDDEKSIQILSNCRRSLASAGRLLLIDRTLSPQEKASPLAFLDLTLLVGGGGTSRSEAEYQALLAKAGFELLRVVPTKTEVSIFEARPE